MLYEPNLSLIASTLYLSAVKIPYTSLYRDQQNSATTKIAFNLLQDLQKHGSGLNPKMCPPVNLHRVSPVNLSMSWTVGALPHNWGSLQFKFELEAIGRGSSITRLHLRIMSIEIGWRIYPKRFFLQYSRAGRRETMLKSRQLNIHSVGQTTRGISQEKRSTTLNYVRSQNSDGPEATVSTSLLDDLQWHGQ
jgi:hypothetical protein